MTEWFLSTSAAISIKFERKHSPPKSYKPLSAAVISTPPKI